MDVSSRRLQHFVTLAEKLHFTHAAHALHISQQGLSRSISQLEREVGAPLLVRTKRFVALTEAGQVFLGGAQAMLATLDTSAEAARSVHGKVAGHLRVGFTVCSALELTSPIFREFQSRYPAVTVDLQPYGWQDPSCGLHSGATDIAFVRMPIDLGDIQTEPVLVEPRAIGVHSSNPLATRPSVTLSDLAGERIMAPSTDDEAWAAFWTLRDTGCDEAALPRPARAAGSMEEELEAVAAGFAISITAASMSRFTPRTSVVFRAITDVVGSELVLGWRGRGTPRTEAFRSVVMEVRDREPGLLFRIATACGNPKAF